MNYRRQQLNSLIRNEVAAIVQREVEFPIGILATITHVDVAQDMEEAVIFVSVFPSTGKDAVLGILKKRRGEIQTALYKRAKTMMLPPIRFEYDPGSEKSSAIEKISLEDK